MRGCSEAGVPVALVGVVTVGVASPAASAPPPVRCGTVITVSATLTADVGPCPRGGLVIGADNITVDLGGFGVIGKANRTGDGRGPIDHLGLGVDSRDALEAMRDRLVDAGAEVGDIQQLGDIWSLFFRDPDGMELEVCAPM